MIYLIAAVDSKKGIAKHGYQPWYIPEDDQYFLDTIKTLGANILYGRNTFEMSLKSKPLKDRSNYILTRQNMELPQGVSKVSDLEGFLDGYRQDKNIWVIGGANVYKQVIDLGLADKLYLTEIEADFNCDQFFPDYSKQFNITSKSEVRHQNGFSYSYCVYSRKV